MREKRCWSFRPLSFPARRRPGRQGSSATRCRRTCGPRATYRRNGQSPRERIRARCAIPCRPITPMCQPMRRSMAATIRPRHRADKNWQTWSCRFSSWAGASPVSDKRLPAESALSGPGCPMSPPVQHSRPKSPRLRTRLEPTFKVPGHAGARHSAGAFILIPLKTR